MKQGDKINLVRHTDNNVIQITKTIKKVSNNHITFEGLQKTFTIYNLPNGYFQFANGNTYYSTEPYTKPKTQLEKYGAFTTTEVEQ